MLLLLCCQEDSWKCLLYVEWEGFLASKIKKVHRDDSLSFPTVEKEAKWRRRWRPPQFRRLLSSPINKSAIVGVLGKLRRRGVGGCNFRGEGGVGRKKKVSPFMGRREANGKCNELVLAHLLEDSHKKMTKATRNERSFSKYKAGSHPTSCIIKSQRFTILLTLRYHENWVDLPHCLDLFNLSGERRGGMGAPKH